MLKLLFDSFETIRHAETLGALHLEMDRFAKRMGFNCFAFALRIASPSRSSQQVILTDYPREWTERYVAGSYFTKDPIVYYCERGCLPAIWDERTFHGEGSREFWEEAESYGVRSGLSFAVHERPGTAGIFSLSRDQNLDLSAQDLAALAGRAQVFASVVHHAVIRIKLPTVLPVAHRDLTPRERECLKWAAEGKTALEIGRAVGVAERTVIFHLNNAMHKLGAVNRTQAVVRALSLNLLF